MELRRSIQGFDGQSIILLLPLSGTLQSLEANRYREPDAGGVERRAGL